VVGTNAKVASEGYDRESLALPGRQDELVAAVNPRTVVIVNSGSPVLPWWESVRWEKLETLKHVCTGMCSCGVWTPSAGDFHLAIDVKRVW
jgi:hypothetical protein